MNKAYDWSIQFNNIGTSQNWTRLIWHTRTVTWRRRRPVPGYQGGDRQMSFGHVMPSLRNRLCLRQTSVHLFPRRALRSWSSDRYGQCSYTNDVHRCVLCTLCTVYSIQCRLCRVYTLYILYTTPRILCHRTMYGPYCMPYNVRRWTVEYWILHTINPYIILLVYRLYAMYNVQCTSV